MTHSDVIRFADARFAYKYAEKAALLGKRVHVTPAPHVGADTVVCINPPTLDAFADAVKQLCADYSDRANRPYMGDVHAAIDQLKAIYALGGIQ